MMISHYQHLMREEGEDWTKQMIIRGSTRTLGAGSNDGVDGGLGFGAARIGAGRAWQRDFATSCRRGFGRPDYFDFCSIKFVTPALFWRFGKPIGDKIIAERKARERAVERGLVAQDPDRHLFDDLLSGVDLDGAPMNGEAAKRDGGDMDHAPFDETPTDDNSHVEAPTTKMAPPNAD